MYINVCPGCCCERTAYPACPELTDPNSLPKIYGDVGSCEPTAHPKIVCPGRCWWVAVSETAYPELAAMRNALVAVSESEDEALVAMARRCHAANGIRSATTPAWLGS